MKSLKLILALTLSASFISCTKSPTANTDPEPSKSSDPVVAESPVVAPTYNDILVDSVEAFRSAVSKLKAGDRLLLADGAYKDAGHLTFHAAGTLEKPILIAPQNQHQVTFTGEVSWIINGQHITFSGLDFVDCINVPTDKPYASLIHSKNSSDSIRFSGCRFIKCELELKKNGKSKGRLITLHGDNHRFDHCFFYDAIGGALAFKGPDRLSDRNEKGFGRIDHNIFRNMKRQRALRDQGEAIFLGVGFEHYSHHRLGVIVEHNIFDQANGDHHGEIITIKSSENTFRHNLFVNAPDSHLSLRSTDNCRIYNNLFQDLANGMWVTGEGHHIYNNYFHDIKNAALLFQPGNIKGIVDNKGVIMIHDVYLDRKETPNFYQHISETYGAAWRPAKNTVIMHNHFSGLHRHGVKAIDNKRSKVGSLPIENNLIANNIFETAPNNEGAALMHIQHTNLNTVSDNIYVNPTNRPLGHSGSNATILQTSPYTRSGATVPLPPKTSQELKISELPWSEPDFFDQPRRGPRYSVGPIEIDGEPLDLSRINLPPVPPMPESLKDQPLSAKFKTFPSEIKAGDYLVLDAAYSSGDVIEYTWDFGDGSTATGRGNSIAHRWDTPGKYRVSLTTTDPKGETSTYEQSFTVARH